MKHIVKRGGRTETYDERKVYASVYAACVSVRETPETAELIADRVSKDITTWLQQKSEVSSRDIRANTGRLLQNLNEHAAFMYTHHRILW
jgi:transcriptional regulator NrdR family protein